MGNNESNARKSSFEDLIGDLLSEAEEELASESSAQLSPQERAMAEIAQQILRLERDMLLPGSEQGTADRVKRLGDFIERQEF